MRKIGYFRIEHGEQIHIRSQSKTFKMIYGGENLNELVVKMDNELAKIWKKAQK